jgi:hypothetical protein
MKPMELFYNLLVLCVFYILGGISVAMLAGMVWPQYVPWIGLLCAVIYALIITITMGIVGHSIGPGAQ